MMLFSNVTIKKALKRALLPLVLFTLSCSASILEAAPAGQYYQDPNAGLLRQMRDTIEDLRHEVNNHEAEIREYDEKLKNFDTIIESVRDQLSDSNKVYREQLKGSTASLESRIISLETTTKGLVTDLRQFKTHSNETSTVLAHYKQKLIDLEKNIEQQNQNIGHLQAAMGALMEALQGKPQSSAKPAMEGVNSISSSTDRSYKVKSGDSLEKIARNYQVSIQSLKEANGLTADKIVVGKTLIIPEK